MASKEIKLSNDYVISDWSGKSTDVKPTKSGYKPLGAGCWYLETDTRKVFYYDSEEWIYMYTIEG